MCHQPPGSDVCITFKSSLMRGRFSAAPMAQAEEAGAQGPAMARRGGATARNGARVRDMWRGRTDGDDRICGTARGPATARRRGATARDGARGHDVPRHEVGEDGRRRREVRNGPWCGVATADAAQRGPLGSTTPGKKRARAERRQRRGRKRPSGGGHTLRRASGRAGGQRWRTRAMAGGSARDGAAARWASD